MKVRNKSRYFLRAIARHIDDTEGVEAFSLGLPESSRATPGSKSHSPITFARSAASAASISDQFGTTFHKRVHSQTAKPFRILPNQLVHNGLTCFYAGTHFRRKHYRKFFFNLATCYKVAMNENSGLGRTNLQSVRRAIPRARMRGVTYYDNLSPPFSQSWQIVPGRA